MRLAPDPVLHAATRLSQSAEDLATSRPPDPPDTGCSSERTAAGLATVTAATQQVAAYVDQLADALQRSAARTGQADERWRRLFAGLAAVGLAGPGAGGGHAGDVGRAR